MHPAAAEANLKVWQSSPRVHDVDHSAVARHRILLGEPSRNSIARGQCPSAVSQPLSVDLVAASRPSGLRSRLCSVACRTVGAAIL